MSAKAVEFGSINIFSVMGIMNDAKIKKLREIKDLTEINLPNNGANKLFGTPQKNTISVGSAKIIYTITSDENFEHILKEIYDSLLIDEDNSFNIQFVKNIPAIRDSFAESKDKFSPNVLKKDWKELRGTGYRFITKSVEDDGAFWDFRVEPLFSDEKFFYLGGMHNFKKTARLEEIVEYYKNDKLYFDDYVKKIKTLFE